MFILRPIALASAFVPLLMDELTSVAFCRYSFGIVAKGQEAAEIISADSTRFNRIRVL